MKAFERFAKKNRLTDAKLLSAADEIERGLVDADLGGGVVKKRIARPGGGKSGGFRSILAYREHAATFFLFGFAKNEQDDIAEEELQNLKRLATA